MIAKQEIMKVARELKLDEDELVLRLGNVVKTAGELSGISFNLVSLERTREVFGEEAYEGKVEYIGPLQKRSGSLPRIKLDITFYEKIIFQASSRPLIHNYSDNYMCARNIEVYSIEEILAEKLRSILQRTSHEISMISGICSSQVSTTLMPKRS